MHQAQNAPPAIRILVFSGGKTTFHCKSWLFCVENSAEAQFLMLTQKNPSLRKL
jgi:hypothetical protein